MTISWLHANLKMNLALQLELFGVFHFRDKKAKGRMCKNIILRCFAMTMLL